jgi:hypothetical protein
MNLRKIIDLKKPINNRKSTIKLCKSLYMRLLIINCLLENITDENFFKKVIHYFYLNLIIVILIYILSSYYRLRYLNFLKNLRSSFLKNLLVQMNLDFF